MAVKVIVVGGGAAGCGAALAARKAGVEVVLLERTDMLLGAALVAGHCDQGGRFTLSQEAKAMGAAELFDALESIALPTKDRVNKLIPASEELRSKLIKAYIYDLGLAEPVIRKLLQAMGITVLFWSRAVEVALKNDRITAVRLANKEWIDGDAFVDCTGTFGRLADCIKYGGGCVMCPFYRCLTFGDRVSIATKAGAQELVRRRPDGAPGIHSRTLNLFKESLSPELQKTLATEGIIFATYRGVIDWEPDPSLVISASALTGIDAKTGEPLYAASFKGPKALGKIHLCDMGGGLVIGGGILPPIPLGQLRKLPGFENALIQHPQGGKTNHLRSLSITPPDNSLKVADFQNLFVAGEKAGAMGVQECIAYGLLAGHNAVRAVLGKDPLVLPRTTVTGDYIAFVCEMLETPDGLNQSYSPRSGLYLDRIIKLGLFSLDEDKIREVVDGEKLTGVYSKKLV